MGKSLIGVPLRLSAVTANHQDAAYPASNLITTQVRGGDRYHSEDLDLVRIDADLGSITPWNLLGLIYTNATADAGIRWRAAATQADLDTAPVLDTYPFGPATRLDGLNDLLTCSDANFAALTSYSISCRLRPRVLRRQGVLELVDGAAHQFAISMRASDGALRGWTTGLTANLLGPIPSRSGFTRVTLTYDAATQTVQLIVDGVLIGSTGGVAAPLAVPTSIIAGFVDVDRFDGDVDDIRLWSYARSAAQELADAGGELVGSPAGLVGYWKLNDGSGVVGTNAVAGESIELIGGARWCLPLQLWWSPNLEHEPFRHSYYVLPTGVGTARWIRCEIVDPTNPANYFAAGRLVVANAHIFRKGRRYGDRFGSVDQADRVRLHGATLVRGSGLRATQDFTIVSDDPAELRRACRRIRALAGSTVPVVALHDHDDEILRHYDSIYGTIADQQDDVDLQRGVSEATFQIEEF